MTDATRIERSVPTVRELLDQGAKVVVLAHFGRPKGKRESFDVAAPAVPAARAGAGRHRGGVRRGLHRRAGRARGRRAPAGRGWRCSRTSASMPGEEKNDPAFADQLARLGELYVDDAFSAAHRAHASITGLAERLPAAAGRLMQAEVEALSRALEDPDRPLAALVGGAKVSTKLDLLGNLVDQGRSPGAGRRHGEHVPVRPRHAGRPLAVRAGHGRDRARGSSPRPRPGTARSCCRSTAGWRASSRPGRPRARCRSSWCRTRA